MTKFKLSTTRILTFSLGIIYFWFGMLKYFPNLSPAEELAKNTISAISFHLIPPHISIVLLAIWETLLGILFLTNIYRKTAVIIALVHMGFTFFPLFLFPDDSFVDAPFQFTIIGQYIMKNVVIVASLLILYKDVTHSE